MPTALHQPLLISPSQHSTTDITAKHHSGIPVLEIIDLIVRRNVTVLNVSAPSGDHGANPKIGGVSFDPNLSINITGRKESTNSLIFRDSKDEKGDRYGNILDNPHFIIINSQMRSAYYDGKTHQGAELRLVAQQDSSEAALIISLKKTGTERILISTSLNDIDAARALYKILTNDPKLILNYLHSVHPNFLGDIKLLNYQFSDLRKTEVTIKNMSASASQSTSLKFHVPEILFDPIIDRYDLVAGIAAKNIASVQVVAPYGNYGENPIIAGVTFDSGSWVNITGIRDTAGKLNFHNSKNDLNSFGNMLDDPATKQSFNNIYQDGARCTLKLIFKAGDPSQACVAFGFHLRNCKESIELVSNGKIRIITALDDASKAEVLYNSLKENPTLIPEFLKHLHSSFLGDLDLPTDSYSNLKTFVDRLSPSTI